MPVRKVCEMARARGIETIVDGAHSFAQFDFKRDDLQCDYFGTSLAQMALRAERHGNVVCPQGKNPESLGVDGGGRQEQKRYSQI